ncbi:MFS transporter [Micromonospora sp. NPDC048830]|uniref:MFS transporter n=1 Tax=Micromonospora sp. NPDC048830 TaxID=3364257 RepID=UPI00371358A2
MSSSATPRSMEDAPFSRFHVYMTWCTAGGPFCDGYILGVIAIALAPLARDLDLSAGWQGALGAASLLGLFVGAAVFGRVTDLVGRRLIYMIALAVFVGAGSLQFFAGDAWQLLVLRFVLGVAIGADYAVATTLLTEFLPRHRRGQLLGVLTLAWWAGYVASFAAGYLMLGLGSGAWRWMLASSAVPAVLVLALRAKAPESPLWLAQRGRREEALVIVRDRIGSSYTLPEVPADEQRAVRWAAIFRSGYGRRTFFVSAFWSAQVAPLFALFTFQPQVLQMLGVESPDLGSLVVSLFFLVGVLPGIFLVGSWGRRPVLLWGFVGPTVVLAVLGLTPGLGPLLVVAGFALFAIFNAGASVLPWIYPNELFPTGVRATAVGFSAAMSRIAAAAGTFLFPLGIATFGIGPPLLAAAAISLGGLLVSLPLAPETRHLRLGEASRAQAKSSGDAE